jgi:hypothetical protein
MTEPLGEDPARWLDRVCEECGRLMEETWPTTARCSHVGVRAVRLAEAQTVTARVPEMAAAKMPLGTVEPRSPERRGELVVQGSSTHGAMPPVGQGDPRFVYQHKDLTTPRQTTLARASAACSQTFPQAMSTIQSAPNE